MWLYCANEHFRTTTLQAAAGKGLPGQEHWFQDNDAVQAKLLEAVASQRETGRQLQQAQQAFDAERAHLEQQVRRSKEEGSVRVQTLEDTIRKLGNRSDLHQVRSLSQFCQARDFELPSVAPQVDIQRYCTKQACL